MMDALLKYGFDLKEELLQSKLYYKDTANMDAVPPGNNSGLMSRVASTANGTKVTLEGPIHTDVFQHDQLILNGVKIVIKLHPSDKKFCLMSADSVNYKFSITSAVLKVCHVKVRNVVILGQNEAFNISPSLDPCWKSNFKTTSVPAGVGAVISDDIFYGSVPGDYMLNHFNFIHANVNSVELLVDGQSAPAQALRPNFETGDYTTSFLSMFFYNYPHHAGGNWVTCEEYAN